MVYFQTQNPDLGKFWRALDWKILIFFMAIWSILQLFDMFCAFVSTLHGFLVYFFPFWYAVPRKILQPWRKA
jgi:hypothetical protein